MTGALPLLEVGALRHARALPAEGEVLVREGDLVAPDDVVAETEFLPASPYFVDLRSLLRLREWDREAGPGFVLKRPGDRVEKGEVVARRRAGLFGEAVEAESPVAGTVEWVSTARGEMMIREDARSAEEVIAVNVARRLGVWPASVPGYLQVREGQEVRAGGLLAALPSGLGIEAVYAPVAGRVERVDPGTGIVYIVRPSRVRRLQAAYGGRVVAVEPGRSLTIETDGLRVWGAFGAGRLTWGPLVAASPDAAVAGGEEPEPGWRGAVVFVPGFADAALLRRARASGARAVVSGSASASALAALWGRPPARAGDAVEPAVVLLEGFGGGAADPRVAEALTRAAGALATVDPTTQVRAGSRRPEVVVPWRPAGLDPLWARPASGEPGEEVYIVRGPHRGRRGRVLERLARSEFPSGVRAAAVRVRLLPDTGALGRPDSSPPAAGRGADADPAFAGEATVALDNAVRRVAGP
ncbi:MAG: KOW motif-containing protein [Clostridia bacterium]|nr:KOW motif-containing protein [Clostridia bacterium]